MTNGHRDTISKSIVDFRDLLVEALREGKDMEEVIRELNKVIRRRQREEEAIR